jgi:hypothetical protein
MFRLNTILPDDKNDATFFHQFGLMQAYLSKAPSGSDDAHVYKRKPSVAHPYAFECSNLCCNIFAKEGCQSKIDSSVVYVMTSELSLNKYSEIKRKCKFINLDDYLNVAGVTPSVDGKQCMQWFADESILPCLKVEESFFNGLLHPSSVKKSLNGYANDFVNEYGIPKKLVLKSLHPYLAHMVNDHNMVSRVDFEETQYAISIALLSMIQYHTSRQVKE